MSRAVHTGKESAPPIPPPYGRRMPGKGRPVLVTGASSGLGLETALHLAAQGFHVYATMRDLSRKRVLIERAHLASLPVSVLRLDVTDEESVHTALHEILDEEGSLYGVVNNAGIILRGFFEDLTDQEIRSIFATNLLGVMTVTRSVLPSMRSAGQGRIIMIGSTGGRIASPGASAYCATKFALAGFSESLAQEVLPFGIRVILVEPGIVNTELFGQNMGIAEGAGRPESPYASLFGNLLSLSLERSSTARLTPLDVAKTVSLSLTSRKPRTHYVVGRTASLLVALKTYAPEDLFQRIFTKMLYRRITT